MAARQAAPRAAGRRTRTVRGVARDARHAHAVPACAHGLRERAEPIAEHFASTANSGGALSRTAHVPRTRDGSESRCAAAFGGMLSVRVRGSEKEACPARQRPLRPPPHVELWKRATSLGGVESLVEHRASIGGAGTPAPADLLRLSVGIEDTGDLIADLESALSQSQ